MRIMSVVGARPQFVKAAVVSEAMRCTGDIAEILVHTGQHYDANMSQLFFDELGIAAPDHHLGVGSGLPGAQTAAMIERLEQVALAVKPDGMLTYGDTNSTLAAALVAAKLVLPLAHVEAGLRSFNRAMPEEVNRIVTDRLSQLLFAPTRAAVDNLRHEGVPPETIFQTGDVMFDATLRFSELAAKQSRVLARLGLAPGSYLLATVHRAENTDDRERLAAILAGLHRVSHEIDVVFPMHPRTRSALQRADLPPTPAARLHTIEPTGYLDMLELERNARLIATDSGGVQKEAFFHRVPCVTLRTETEWVELVEAGWNRLLAPSDAETVHAGLAAALGDAAKPAQAPAFYGDGTASARIAAILAGLERGSGQAGSGSSPPANPV
ncbi:MAG: UDP-N-acetylglucosamine 2-epimerase (non-hydrolyzing) [Alphaproteobacteria bacterium]|nr:UDP-N-acetylglucosamine 2-epimerase (non-hydrolyzing) [Alphaproteobacteria bacterium]MBV9862225.1 UDP-N-acetylglucosamine 2-epimerase (non-hydrolyzing) [Alphaproteobacteria bacterium]